MSVEAGSAVLGSDEQREQLKHGREISVDLKYFRSFARCCTWPQSFLVVASMALRLRMPGGVQWYIKRRSAPPYDHIIFGSQGKIILSDQQKGL